jgi:hypothetical protein
MKLNSNTTTNNTNTPSINLQDTLWAMSQETWALENIAHIGQKAAFDDVDPVALAHQFETLEKRLEALHEGLHNHLHYSKEVKALTPTPQAQDAQALLALLLGMLKEWRNFQSSPGNQLNAAEFQAKLEKAVVLTSSMIEEVKP